MYNENIHVKLGKKTNKSSTELCSVCVYVRSCVACVAAAHRMNVAWRMRQSGDVIVSAYDKNTHKNHFHSKHFLLDCFVCVCFNVLFGFTFKGASARSERIFFFSRVILIA